LLCKQFAACDIAMRVRNTFECKLGINAQLHMLVVMGSMLD